MGASPGAQTANVETVAVSTTVATLLPASAGRWSSIIITNASSSVLFIKFGFGAASSDFTVRLSANTYFEMPARAYHGAITGILDTGTGNAQVTTW